jgi:peptide chain release factor 2
MHRPAFWEAPEAAQRVLKEHSDLRGLLERQARFARTLEDLRTLLDLAVEEADEASLAEVRAGLTALRGELAAVELETVLGGEHDRGAAILAINAGAGGTESQDWAQMLLRMYARWAEGRGLAVEVVDLLEGEEAGIKNATLTVTGPCAYGLLRAETGVHRLVRISPFDASRRRHTSFASVFVFPAIEDDIEVAIDEKDLRIDTYRSSGAGGQHVNVTDSAVRITHLPTGIVVTCQNERSQHKNKAMAMKVLRARLYDLRRQEKEKELQSLHGEKKEIAWGSQIRSYVLAPYQLVKDHRTGVETSQVSAVLDGELDPFIQAALFQRREQAGHAARAGGG